MIPASQPARRPSVLHIFKVYYPDLFGGTLSVIRDICAGLKDIFSAGVLVCSRTGGKSQIVVNDVAVERVHSFGDVLSLPAAPTYPLRLWRRIAEHDLRDALGKQCGDLRPGSARSDGGGPSHRVNTALDTGVPHVARDGIEAITAPAGDAEKLGDAINTLIADPETASADGHGRTSARHHEIFHDSLQGGS